MKKILHKEYDDNLRKNIINNIFNSIYYIEDNSLYIEIENKGLFVVELSEFYQIFDYLLNIDNYSKVFLDNSANRSHALIIASIIKNILSQETINKDCLIPVILTTILSQSIPNYSNIDTSNFTIENIKITELYSLAGLNKPTDANKTAKWNKILIPNEYLYRKIKELSIKGMYYYQDDRFILENIENNTSDFKISINIEKMKEFLKSNLNNLTKKA